MPFVVFASFYCATAAAAISAHRINIPPTLLYDLTVCDGCSCTIDSEIITWNYSYLRHSKHCLSQDRVHNLSPTYAILANVRFVQVFNQKSDFKKYVYQMSSRIWGALLYVHTSCICIDVSIPQRSNYDDDVMSTITNYKICEFPSFSQFFSQLLFVKCLKNNKYLSTTRIVYWTITKSS